MIMNHPRLLIIGAGPCGLGAGWRLHELGYTNVHIYEKEKHAGGLARSFVDPRGFTWDIGGHVLHSHYDYFDRMFETVMRGEYMTHHRESWVWILNRFVPYPFQNNIRHLPPTVRDECLKGLYELVKKPSDTPHDFADWIIASFGKGIAKHFLLPYNKKVWAYPPNQMSYQWVGDRVARVDIDRVKRNIREEKDDVSWGPNAVFHFPKHGGTGDIWNRVAKTFAPSISYRKEVIRIDTKRRTVHFSDGSSDWYDALLSTMPLNILIEKTGIPQKRTFDLHYSHVTIVGIGIQGDTPELLQSKCWMYFPERFAPFFRATVFSNYSKYNAPTNSWSLMTEISSSAYRALPKGDIAALVIEGAKRVRLIAKNASIESTWVFHSQYGYPTPTLGRDDYLRWVLPELETNNIYSRGRFGAWKYEVSNQDHTFMQGVEWADRMVKGKAEITLFNPNRVNAAYINQR